MVHTIAWRVGSPAALDFWAARLAAEGVEHERDERSLRLADPEGLAHELVVTDAPDAPLIADHPEIPAELALEGFEGVRAYSHRPDASAAVLERLMGAARTGDTFSLRGDKRGGWIAFDPAPEERGRQSAGTVHHIAWGPYDPARQGGIARVTEAALGNSGYVDRHYFHSLYFREPGGILYELA